MVSRELLAGLEIGAVLAVIAGPIVWWRWGDAGVAFSVGLSVLAACPTATLAAMTLPWLFDACDLDPAFGSGPLATLVQDLLSIWIYSFITTVVISEVDPDAHRAVVRLVATNHSAHQPGKVTSVRDFSGEAKRHSTR